MTPPALRADGSALPATPAGVARQRRKPPAGTVENASPRLPAPLYQNWAWQAEAACRDVNPDVFFAVDFERGLRRRAKELLATSLCATCPVQQPCRAYAVEVGEEYGVWGGTTEYERGSTQASAERPTGRLGRRQDAGEQETRDA